MSDTRRDLYLTYLTNCVETAKYPTYPHEIVKWERVRTWEETESGHLDQFKFLSEFKPPANRSSLGFWVEYSIRLASMSGEYYDSAHENSLDASTCVPVPFITYSLKCRPENIDKMIEKIKNRQLIEKKEGTTSEAI